MTTSPINPSPLSRLCALLGLMVWTLNAFGALVVTTALAPSFKQFDAKMPAPTQFVLWGHWGLGTFFAGVVLAILAKECGWVKWKKPWDGVLLVLGLLICTLMYLFLWLPIGPMPTSQMGGG